MLPAEVWRLALRRAHDRRELPHDDRDPAGEARGRQRTVHFVFPICRRAGRFRCLTRGSVVEAVQISERGTTKISNLLKEKSRTHVR